MQDGKVFYIVMVYILFIPHSKVHPKLRLTFIFRYTCVLYHAGPMLALDIVQELTFYSGQIKDTNHTERDWKLISMNFIQRCEIFPVILVVVKS